MDICDSYHRDTEGFNAMARRQVGKQPGLLHAYRKAALEAGAKKTKAGKEIEVTHPLVPFRTVQDWWTEGKWTKDDAVTTTAGRGRTLIACRRTSSSTSACRPACWARRSASPR